MTGRGTLLVGASGLAREVLAADITEVVGILDDDETLHGTTVAGVTVLGPVADAARRTESVLVCVGSGVARREVVRRLADLGMDKSRYRSFVAGHALVGKTSCVGAGCILLDGVVVTANAVLGRHVVVMPNTTITHDDVVEDFATLAAGVALGGGVRVGEAAYLGMNSAVHPNVRIGAQAVIGMGAVVLKDIPHGEIWVGVPARNKGDQA